MGRRFSEEAREVVSDEIGDYVKVIKVVFRIVVGIEIFSLNLAN